MAVSQGIARRGLFVVLFGLCILAALWSLASGVAALAAWQAGRIAADAPARGPRAGGAEDRAIRNRLAIAAWLDPMNPRYPESLARHLELLAGQHPPHSFAQRPLLDAARGLYLASVARRPTWPYGFSSVLHIDFRLGRLGPAFTRGYARAADLGRGETVARRALVGVGLASWPALEPDARELVLALVRHDLTTDPRSVLMQAISLGRGALLEPLISADPELVRLDAELRNAQPRRGARDPR